MKLHIYFSFILVSIAFFTAGRTASAQDFPTGLLQALPHAAEKLSSDDVNVRASILRELVVPDLGGCTMEVTLRFGLSKEDYAFIVDKILEKDMRQLEAQDAGTQWSLLTHLVGRFEMKEFAAPLAAYLAKGYIDDSKWAIQYMLIQTLEKLKAKEFDSKIALYLGNQNLANYALGALISFKSGKAVPALIDKLAYENSRFWAIDKLAEIGAVEAGPQIAEVLKDEDENMPYWAIDGLARLNARAQSKDLWQFLKYSKNERFKGFAVAVLIQFEQKEAVPLAVDSLKAMAQGSENYYVWEFIDKLKPKLLIPTLISLYHTKTPFFANAEHEKKFRFKVLQALFNYKTPLAIPIYRENLVDKSDRMPSNWVAHLLQELNATEAIDDIITVFNGLGTTISAGEFGIALAKFGDPKSFKMLIDYVEKSNYYNREQIIIELNKQADRKLWDESHKKVLPVMGPASIRVLAEKFRQETGIPVVIEYVPKPGESLCTVEDYEDKDDGFPCIYVDGQTSLYNTMQLIVSYLNNKSRGEYTFIFDRGTIRILKTNQAAEWWRKNILTKAN